MRIPEVDIESNADRLTALANFLNGRAEDQAAPRQISTTSFINLARGMGINIGVAQLKDLVQSPPLNSVIVDVQGDNDTGKVIFKGGDAEVNQNTMSVDQAQKTVNTMAKRAASKTI